MLKNPMKTAGVIAVLLLIATSVKAEEKLSKEKWVKAEQMAGHVFLLARRHLNDEENKTLSDLISKGVERGYRIESEKTAPKKGDEKK